MRVLKVLKVKYKLTIDRGECPATSYAEDGEELDGVVHHLIRTFGVPTHIIKIEVVPLDE